MSANLAATIFGTAGVMLALLLLPFAAARRLDTLRAAAIWIVALALMMFIADPLVTLIFMGLILLCVAPLNKPRRAALYLAVMPCLPLYVAADLPFPGINYLTQLNFHKVAAFALLVPLLVLGGPPRKHDAALTIADICVAAFILYTTIVFAMGETITSGLRFLLDQCLLIGAPYFAFSRAINSAEDAEECLQGFLTASAILAGIALVATAKQWDFYRLLEPPSVFGIPDYRGGLLRIFATANTHSLGFHLVCALVILEYLKTRMSFGFIRLMMLRGALLAGVFVTGSRGSLAALVVAAAVYVLLTTRSAALRWGMVAGLAGLVIGGTLWLLSGDAQEADPYGTFDYRQQLLTASLSFLSSHLLFGDFRFLQSGHFDHLVQGQGIIDVTNYYLQVALQYGLVGVVLVFLPFAIVMPWLAFYPSGWHQADGAAPAGDDVRMRGALCAILAGWLVLVATTSNVALTLHLGLVFLGLGVAVSRGRIARYVPRTALYQRPPPNTLMRDQFSPGAGSQ